MMILFLTKMQIYTAYAMFNLVILNRANFFFRCLHPLLRFRLLHLQTCHMTFECNEIKQSHFIIEYSVDFMHIQ